MPRQVLALLLLAACGSDGQAPDTDTDAPDTDAQPTAATFAEVRDTVLLPSCGTASCHAIGKGELFLTAETTASDLVGVPSSVAPGETLVVANDPDGSYLVKKIEDAPDIVGGEMPPPFGGLAEDDLQLIRDWIAAGAQ